MSAFDMPNLIAAACRVSAALARGDISQAGLRAAARAHGRRLTSDDAEMRALGRTLDSIADAIAGAANSPG